MLRFTTILSSLISLSLSYPGIIHDDSSSLSIPGHGDTTSFLSAGGGHGFSLGSSDSGSSNYGVIESHGGHEDSGHGGGDFHHGVSVVGLGNGKGVTLDLTKGGGGHDGAFGGSFVASSKYSSGGHGGGDAGGHGGHGYAVAESGGGFEGHYSDVLGASDSGSDDGGASLGGHEIASSGWN